MGRKKAQEKEAQELADIDTRIIVRDDIHEQIRKLYPLCELISERRLAEAPSTDPALSLARTYLRASAGLELFSLYSFAMQAYRLGQQLAGDKQKAAGDGESAKCLHQLYADRWTQMPTNTQRRVKRDFDGKMRAGSIVVRLVARFGTGILLTCKANVHRL
jgi:hypothetical protein